MISRWRLTAAAAVLAAALAACGHSDNGTADGPFGNGGTPGAHCTAAQSPHQVVTNGDQFIQNPGPRARITALSLANDHGIELLRAWIVQITGHTLYGNWLGWPVNRPQLLGVHWETRQAADGASIAPTKHLNGYNIVLAIRLAPSRREGWARGVSVRYTAGGKDYTLLTATRIAIATSPSLCDSLVQQIPI
ncbi:MAG TPA: hypothetical protein VEV61_10320 [Streptosporangiaceae bacterium]|nr:hypothetical protein [Streptosporangiaceae bacterium]